MAYFSPFYGYRQSMKWYLAKREALGLDKKPLNLPLGRGAKRCVWCWKLKRGTDFRRVSPIKVLYVCTDCEKVDPAQAEAVTAERAKQLKQQKSRQAKK